MLTLKGTEGAHQQQVAERSTAERWRGDPFCPTDWRWQDAQRIADGRLPTWSDTDPGVLRVASYLRVASECASPKAVALERRWPDLVRARELYEAGGLLRSLLEARLLAGQEDPAIAERLQLSPAVVACYESVYFNVREFLKASDWIHGRVLGMRSGSGFRHDELGAFWKWSAYVGGVGLLDGLVGWLLKAVHAGQPAALSAYLAPEAGLPVPVQAFVAMKVLPQGLCIDRLFRFERRSGLAAVPKPGLLAERHKERLRRQTIDLARAYLKGELSPRPVEPVIRKPRAARKPSRTEAEPCRQAVATEPGVVGQSEKWAALMSGWVGCPRTF
jgi:hypothetical protein